MSHVGTSREGRRPVTISIEKLFDKVPPHSLEAEMALLGSMLLDPRVIGEVLPLVASPKDFYSEGHGNIFKAIVDLYDQRLGDKVDVVHTAEFLRDHGTLEAVGGIEFLGELVSGVPTASSAPHYAKIVADKARLRKLIDAAGEILYDSYHVGDLGPDGAKQVVEKAEMKVFEIAQTRDSADPQRLKELLDVEMRRLEAAEEGGGAYTGLPTGFFELDRMLHGLQKGEMIILAARPSMGKTALALNLIEQVVFGGTTPEQRGRGQTTGLIPAALFSLEMSKTAIVQRLLSSVSRVEGQKLRTGRGISPREFGQLMMVAEDLKHAPLYIDDSADMTITGLRSRARRLKAQHDIQLVVIDYLQLVTAPWAGRESRQVEVSTVSRGIKALARELNVPVICLSQLNREGATGDGARPRMSQLRESGSIEQDADVIVLLHREDYYHKHDEQWIAENSDMVGVAELLIEKQRNGPTGVVKLKWDPTVTRFRNLESGAHAPVDMERFDPAPVGDFGDEFPPPKRAPTTPRSQPADPDDQAPF